MSYEKIKTYEAACKVIKVNPKNLPNVSKLPKHEAQHVINSIKLNRIVRALNTNQKTGKAWEPNWHDTNQPKYFVWNKVKATAKKPQGTGFSRSDFDLWASFTGVGSRLSLQSSDRVMHLNKYFKKLLIEYLLITK
jgi:hypothetical protein